MFKRFKNNNKGSTTIVRAISYIFIFLTFTAAIDAVLLLGSMATLSYNAMYVSKQLSINGGLPGHGQNRTIVVEPLQKAARLCGISDDNWSVEIESEGLPGGKADVYPGMFSDEDSNRAPINDIGYMGLSLGHNKIQTLKLTFIHQWKFCPVFYMLNLKTPITISFNYRSEYIRPIS